MKSKKNKWIKFSEGMTCPLGITSGDNLAQCLNCPYYRQIIVTPTKTSVLCCGKKKVNVKELELFKEVKGAKRRKSTHVRKKSL